MLKSLSRTPALLLVMALIATFSTFAFTQEVTDNKKIVILFHNSEFSIFKQEFGEGLRDYIDNLQDEFSSTRVMIELLGLNKVFSEARTEGLIELLKEDQRNDPASVVVSVLSPSAEFLSTYGEEIYGDTPKVYALAGNQFFESLGAQSSRNTIIVPSSMQANTEKTMALVPQLLPNTEQIYVYSGVSPTDLEFLQYARQFSDNSMANIEFTFLAGLPVAELAARLSQLPEDSAIVSLSYGEDRNGQPHRTPEVLDQVFANSSGPIFSPLANIYDNGSAGGNVGDNIQTGRIVAEAALALLSADTSGIDLNRASTYRFNQAELRRWGIDERLLPTESAIYNLQLSFIDIYGRQLLILLAIVSVLLIFLVSFKRQANSADRQKTLFESVINSIPDAILITDTDDKIFNSNIGVKDIFGFERAELVGKSASELVSQADTSDEFKSHSTLDVDGKHEPQILTFEKKNGEHFSGETIATEITNSSGETLGHCALIRDISKRLSLEEEQRQGQKLEALGGLVGGISHDFNNILGVISGYAELSSTTQDIKSIEDNQSKILKATDRAKSLIGQIMTFSRDKNTAKKPIDLAALLDDTMKLTEVSIPSNIELSLQKDGEAHEIMGSAIQLQQIILNLTTNAFQAISPEAGSIKISLDWKQVNSAINLSHGVLSPGRYSVLSIADTGPGMNKEVAARAFDPYFTTKAEDEGSGMGMAIVYKLLVGHDAILDMKTAPGEGLRIAMYFKEAPPLSVVLGADNSEAIVQGDGEHILLVDDEEELLGAVEQLLSRAGYKVTAFKEPRAALETFSEMPESFDLLVSDQSMPKLTGVQLLQEARKLRPDFPAIICTGYSDLLNQKDEKSLGLSNILRKPFTLGEITRAIGDALAENKKAEQ